MRRESWKEMGWIEGQILSRPQCFLFPNGRKYLTTLSPNLSGKKMDGNDIRGRPWSEFTTILDHSIGMSLLHISRSSSREQRIGLATDWSGGSPLGTESLIPKKCRPPGRPYQYQNWTSEWTFLRSWERTKNRSLFREHSSLDAWILSQILE